MSRFLTRGLKGSLVITDLGMDRLAVNWSSIITHMFVLECISCLDLVTLLSTITDMFLSECTSWTWRLRE